MSRSIEIQDALDVLRCRYITNNWHIEKGENNKNKLTSKENKKRKKARETENKFISQMIEDYEKSLREFEEYQESIIKYARLKREQMMNEGVNLPWTRQCL